MPDRPSLATPPRLAWALALLASAVASLASAPFPGPQSPDGPRPQIALSSPPAPYRLTTAAVPDDHSQVEALASEDEEKEGAGPLVAPRVFAYRVGLLSRAADRRPDAPLSVPSLYPLRC